MPNVAYRVSPLIGNLKGMQILCEDCTKIARWFFYSFNGKPNIGWCEEHYKILVGVDY